MVEGGSANIRVAVRCRPILGHEQGHGQGLLHAEAKDNSVSLGSAQDPSGSRRMFFFDNVLDRLQLAGGRWPCYSLDGFTLEFQLRFTGRPGSLRLAPRWGWAVEPELLRGHPLERRLRGLPRSKRGTVSTLGTPSQRQTPDPVVSPQLRFPGRRVLANPHLRPRRRSPGRVPRHGLCLRPDGLGQDLHNGGLQVQHRRPCARGELRHGGPRPGHHPARDPPALRGPQARGGGRGRAEVCRAVLVRADLQGAGV
mmetsp:Transcript_17683/g.57196  ORF Transcript_17683/g.57196 Transcript_17683/m.57196 type:complete len:254 (-) Transcript_17683:954-1715(-)